MAYVGLGANLDDPAAQLQRAFSELEELPRTRLTARSPLYKTPPLGPPAQPDYLNAVVALATELSPLELLAALRAIEVKPGRVRYCTRWGPRTLDLDLLLYGELVLDSTELTLPHPGLHERAFVLYPLLDVAPALIIPGKGSARGLRERLKDALVERLES